MNEELKNEIGKMNQHTEKWIREALKFLDNAKAVRRCCENALNGIVRIEELLED